VGAASCRRHGELEAPPAADRDVRAPGMAAGARRRDARLRESCGMLALGRALSGQAGMCVCMAGTGCGVRGRGAGC
jgi:hypothetical protein